VAQRNPGGPPPDGTVCAASRNARLTSHGGEPRSPDRGKEGV
jgi:hypothetical protein